MQELRQSSKKTFKSAQPALFSLCVVKNSDETELPKFKPFSCAQTFFWVSLKFAEGSRRDGSWWRGGLWGNAEQIKQQNHGVQGFCDIQNNSQVEFVVGFLPPLYSWSLQNSVVKLFSFLFPEYPEINIIYLHRSQTSSRWGSFGPAQSFGAGIRGAGLCLSQVREFSQKIPPAGHGERGTLVPVLEPEILQVWMSDPSEESSFPCLKFLLLWSFFNLLLFSKKRD